MKIKGLITFLGLILAQLNACSNKISIKNGSSLDYYLCNDGIQSGMTLMLSSVVDNIMSKQSFCVVQNVSNVTITSESSVASAKITCSNNWNGFGFYNTTNITLCGLLFLHCGGEITLPFNVQQFTNKSRVFIGPHQRAVLLFSNCLNTTVYNVSIQGSYHGFGIIFINALGQSKIAHVNVSNNLREQICTTISTSKNYSCSGSGIVFLFSELKITKIIENTVVSLAHIQLNNNQNFYSFEKDHAYILDTYKNVPILSGSGLTFLLYCKYTTFISAYMLEVSNNKATHIGGILILFNTSSHHFIILSNVNIENNSIPFTNTTSYSAGITVICISGPSNSTSLHSNLQIMESKITSNKAFKGSGILIHLKQISYFNLFFLLDSCSFVKNEAYSQGSALMVESQNIYRGRSRYFHMHFRNVSAAENSGPQDSNNNYDVSVFLLSPMNTYLTMQLGKFENNVGSVFKVYNNYISLAKGNIQCSNNTSNSGSCFHLIGGSYIKLFAGSFTLFNNNKALLSGGAIYADNQGLPVDLCTVASYTGSEKVFMRFENNTANLDGNDIKSQNIYNCSMYHNKTKLQGSYHIYKKIFHFNTSNLSLSSNVHKLCSSAKNHQIIFSGKTIHIPLKAIDAANHPVYTKVMVCIYTNNGHQWKLEEGTIYSDVYADLKLNNTLSVTILSITNTNSTGKLMIQTISHPPISLTFNVFMMECPHGFAISSTSHRCECSTFLHRVDHSIKCDIQSMTVTMPLSSWFGTIRDQDIFFELFSFNCPPQYCKQSSIFIPNAGSSKSICNNNRTGIMCGQCDNGLSLVFGSEECHQCSNYWILSLIFYAIGGVCLVMTLFSINLTVSNGMLGGIIFFANMSLISLHSDLLSNELYTRPIKIMISFLNLNLGFPVCFYNGMDNITKTALLFSFPLYLWCIVLGLVLISRHSTRVANLIVGSSVQVLATLIHFSFAKLLLNIFNTLTSSNILTSHRNSSYTAWYFDGNIKYFTGSHLVLCVVSITVLVLFILPYLLFLSFASYLGSCPSLNYYLRPMIDAYNGPYKDRYRFWFGMRQWLMVALYVLYSIVRGGHPDVMLAINIIAILFFMTLQLCVKPFKKIIILFIDTWFLFLLICANVIAFLFVSKHNTIFASCSSSEGLTAILLVYLVSVLIIILCHVFVSLKILRRAMKKVSSFLKGTLICLKKITDIDDDNIEHYRAPLLVEVLEKDLQ